MAPLPMHRAACQRLLVHHWPPLLLAHVGACVCVFVCLWVCVCKCVCVCVCVCYVIVRVCVRACVRVLCAARGQVSSGAHHQLRHLPPPRRTPSCQWSASPAFAPAHGAWASQSFGVPRFMYCPAAIHESAHESSSSYPAHAILTVGWSVGPELIICDEAHRLKNDQTKTNVALSSLPCRCSMLCLALVRGRRESSAAAMRLCPCCMRPSR